MQASETIVDIWTWRLDADDETTGALSALLSEDERQRADRFVTPRLSRRWIAGRAGMRQILAGKLSQKAEALVFDVGQHGKPFLSELDSPFPFNLSHSEDLAALAISDQEVGVDVERMEPLSREVAEMFFSPEEVTALDATPEEARMNAFYRCWTAKEAVLKAIGSGLTLPGRSFTVDFWTPDMLRLKSAEWPGEQVIDWQLRSFDPAPGFAGAVAVRNAGPLRVNIHPWDLAR